MGKKQNGFNSRILMSPLNTKLFKAIRGLWPKYINDLIGIKSTSRFSLSCHEREKREH